jgi:hypothetical protein
MAYPTTRRYFRSDEAWNDNVVTAGHLRSIAQFQNYSYARDLPQTPAASRFYEETAWPGRPSGFCWSPRRSLSTGTLQGSKRIALVTCPDPKSSWTTYVSVYVWIKRANLNASSGTVSVTNLRTGVVSSIVVDPSYGQLLMNYPLGLEAQAGDVLALDATLASGQAYEVAGYYMEWSPGLPGNTVANGQSGVANPAWYPLSQAHMATNRPLSARVLQWLGRSCNDLVNLSPLVIANCWNLHPGAGTGVGYNAYDNLVGKYALPLAPTTTQVEVVLRYVASGACSVTCTLSSGETASAVIAGAGAGLAYATINRAAGSSRTMVVLDLTVAGAPASCDIEHVYVYEQHGDAAALSLPAGETVPANWVDNDESRFASGATIRSSDLARLVANMIWLRAHRRRRILVNDNRFTYKENDTATFVGVGGAANANVAGLHAIPLLGYWTPPGTYQVLVRAGWHQGINIVPSPTVDTYFQIGHHLQGDYLGCPQLKHTAGQNAEQAAFQHRWGATVTNPAIYWFETRVNCPAASGGRNTRPSWLTLEVLPHGTPLATYP